MNRLRLSRAQVSLQTHGEGLNQVDWHVWATNSLAKGVLVVFRPAPSRTHVSAEPWRTSLRNRLARTLGAAIPKPLAPSGPTNADPAPPPGIKTFRDGDIIPDTHMAQQMHHRLVTEVEGFHPTPGWIRARPPDTRALRRSPSLALGSLIVFTACDRISLATARWSGSGRSCSALSASRWWRAPLPPFNCLLERRSTR